jgi:hypothetical protein
MRSVPQRTLIPFFAIGAEIAEIAGKSPGTVTTTDNATLPTSPEETNATPGTMISILITG